MRMPLTAAKVSRARKTVQKAEIKIKRAAKVPDEVLKRKIKENGEAIIGKAFKQRRNLITALGEPKTAHAKQAGRRAVEQRKLVTLPLLTRAKDPKNKCGSLINSSSTATRRKG